MNNGMHNGHIGHEEGLDLIIETGDLMRLARTKAGLEQEEIADMLNVSASTISNWENNRVSVKAVYVLGWAQLTGYKMSSLMGPISPRGKGEEIS